MISGSFILLKFNLGIIIEDDHPLYGERILPAMTQISTDACHHHREGPRLTRGVENTLLSTPPLTCSSARGRVDGPLVVVLKEEHFQHSARHGPLDLIDKLQCI